jgi:hypothetical protein
MRVEVYVRPSEIDGKAVGVRPIELMVRTHWNRWNRSRTAVLQLPPEMREAKTIAFDALELADALRKVTS